jgi:nitrite reductase/ring-hydroxylating ferredoxin subunit
MSDDVMLAQLMAMRKQVDALILMVRKQIDLPAGENGCTHPGAVKVSTMGEEGDTWLCPVENKTFVVKTDTPPVTQSP